MKKREEIFYKHLMLVAFRHDGREFTREEATNLYFTHSSRRSIDNTFKVFVSNNEIGSCVMIFDVYVVKELSVYKRCRHYLRMFKTAVLGYVNISTVKIIPSNKDFPFMNRTNKVSLDELSLFHPVG